MNQRILLVEDDPVLADGMSGALRAAGLSVHCIADGIHAKDALLQEQYSALVLDLSLPRMDGIEVLEQLRQHSPWLPVLVVSARQAIYERVKALRLGADDYLTKPFDLQEFEARVHSLLRRHLTRQPATLQVADLSLDPASRTAYVRQAPVQMATREFGILEVLIRYAGQVVTLERLNQSLPGGSEPLTDNVFHLYVSRLRKRIAGSRARIRTIRGFGYMLHADDQQAALP